MTKDYLLLIMQFLGSNNVLSIIIFRYTLYYAGIERKFLLYAYVFRRS